MSTRDFNGPSGGLLARAKLETPTSAAIHASARRKRRRDALEKFPAFRASFDAETLDFAAPSRVAAPRFVSDADGDEARFARRIRRPVGTVFARGALRRTRARKNVGRSRRSRRAAKKAFSSSGTRRFDWGSRKGRAASTSRGWNAFSKGARGVCGGSRRGALEQTLASSRLRDALTDEFGDAAPRSERDFAPTRRLDARSTPRRAREDFSSPARRLFFASVRERTRSASGFLASHRLTSSRNCEGSARWLGRFPRAFSERPAPRFECVGATSFASPRGARKGEWRRRGSSSGFYPEFDAYCGELPAFASSVPTRRENVGRLAFATRAFTPFSTRLGANFDAFDDAAFNRVASFEPTTSRPAARRFRFEEDWRLPFPGIDGVAERALASRRRREWTGEGRRFGKRDAASASEAGATAPGVASWRGADGIDGRDGDARGLATVERLLKESRDALVALARDATCDLTLTTE